MVLTIPKLSPKNLGKVLSTQFVMNGSTVTGLKVQYEVNYGTLSLPMQSDVWNELDASEKAHVQAIYDKITGLVTTAISAAASG